MVRLKNDERDQFNFHLISTESLRSKNETNGNILHSYD